MTNLDPASHPSPVTPPPERDAFRREVRGTALIAGVLAAIVGLGWFAASQVGRTTVILGPGVSFHRGAGWDEPRLGPTDLWSQRWPIGDSTLMVVPQWDSPGLAEPMRDYRLEVIAANDNDAVFAEPVTTAHPTGEARIQHWSTTDASGEAVVGELVAVASGTTVVILDARWPESESPSIVAEIRRVVASLAIEPLGP